MSLLIVILVLVVAALAIAAVRGAAKANADDAAADSSSTAKIDTDRPASVHDIAPGAVVTIAGKDRLVLGTVHFDEDGFRWVEHLLDDTADGRWLSVESDEGRLDIVLWNDLTTDEAVDVDARNLTIGGTSFRRQERGRARYRTEGDTGLPAYGEADYVDFTDGDRRLSAERWTRDGDWELSIGYGLSERTIDVRPAGKGTN